METIYLIICESEYINESNETVMERFTTVYGAYKNIEKAEENKAWYEEQERKTNKNQYIKRKYSIKESTLE